MTILQTGLETDAIIMQPVWQLAFIAPAPDVDRIFDAILAVSTLEHGKTDHNGYLSRDGVEYYRPQEGTPTGAEQGIRHRPNVDDMRICIPRDTQLLKDVIQAIYQSHSYYEPVIIVTEALRSLCKGLDDSDNPNRWWNTTGDWKTD